MRHMLAWSQATGLGASEPGANPIDATASDRSVVPNAKRSQRLLKDVEPGIFFDSVAQVGDLRPEAGLTFRSSTSTSYRQEMVSVKPN